MSMFVLELTRLDADAKVKMEESLYRKSSSKTLTKNGSSRSSNSPTAQLGLPGMSVTRNGRLSVSPEPPGGGKEYVQKHRIAFMPRYPACKFS